jgi:type IV secretion system protein TrbL
MVLAVIVGIGSGFFTDFTGAISGEAPDIDQAMSLVLASLALFGLGIFGPSIASGLVSGAPQLGAGAAVGTLAGGAGMIALGGAAGISAARGLANAGLGAVRAGTAIGAGASAAAQMGRETGGSAIGGIAAAAKGAAKERIGGALGLSAAAERGRDAAFRGITGASPSSSQTGSPAEAAPAWAERLSAEQTSRHRRQLAVHALREGNGGGAGALPDIKERD